MQVVHGKDHRRKYRQDKIKRLIFAKDAIMHLRVSRVDVNMNGHVINHISIAKKNANCKRILITQLKLVVLSQLRSCVYLGKNLGKMSTKEGIAREII